MKHGNNRFFLIFALLLLTCRASPAGFQVNEAVDYYHHAKAAFDRGNIVSADTNLRLALQTLPNFSEAYLLKGLMAFSAGQTDDAQKAFARAEQLIPRLSVEERDALQTQIKNAQQGLSQKVQGIFQIQFHGTMDTAAADPAMQDLQDASDDYSKRFGFVPVGTIPVLVFSDKEFWEDWGIPWWTHHFFDQGDGKIRFRIGPMPGGDAERRRRLRYELMRVSLRSLPGTAVPEWFQVGLGQYEARVSTDSTDTRWAMERLTQLHEAAQGAPIQSMDRLASSLSDKTASEGLRYLADVDSEGLVLNLILQKGDNWVVGLIGRLRHNEPFESAFTQEAGLSPAAALSAWRPPTGS